MMSGNSVPSSTVAAEMTKIKLFANNRASREKAPYWTRLATVGALSA